MRKSKKTIFLTVFCLIVVLLLGASPRVTGTVSNIALFVAGNRVNASVIIVEGRSFLPVRAISEALGAQVDWSEVANRIDVTPDPSRENEFTILNQLLISRDSEIRDLNARLLSLQQTATTRDNEIRNLNARLLSLQQTATTRDNEIRDLNARLARIDVPRFPLTAPLVARVSRTTEDLARLAPGCVLVEALRGTTVISSGSGVFISDNGVVLTNFHVIEGATSYSITLNDGRRVTDVRLLGWDRFLDLSLLQINIPSQGIPLADGAAALGSSVVAIGSPLGLLNSISEGIVSGFRPLEQEYIQTTTALSPGSSGGALLNRFGEIVGVTTAKFVGGENLNLAIPVATVRSFINWVEYNRDRVGTIVYTDGIYHGELRNGLRHGFGTIAWTGEGSYSGYFYEGMLHGKGTYHWPDGRTYFGDWVEGYRTGFGTIVWANGNRYSGQWHEGARTGLGTLVWANGDRYSGQWHEGARTGLGTYIWVNKEEYRGDFVNGNFHGFGTYRFADGTVRVGQVAPATANTEVTFLSFHRDGWSIDAFSWLVDRITRNVRVR